MFLRRSVSFGRPFVISQKNGLSRSMASLPQVNANEFITKSRNKQTKVGPQKESKKIPIISCKRQEFNHYPGQTYGKFDTVPLASVGWHHKRSKGDHFTLNSSNQEIPVESTKPTGLTFDSIGISAELVSALGRKQIFEPMEIQARGIPTLLSGNNALLAAETGCGKTLAFLLPLLQQILLWEPLVKNRSEQFNAPLGLIVSPSRELAYQIAEVARELTGDLPLRTKVLIGGRTKSKMLRPDFERVDLLVATLGALSKLTTTGVYDVGRVRHVVLDEADTLLDDSFREKLTHFLRRFPFQFKGAEDMSHFPSGAQLTLVSATMPTSLPEALDEIILPESLAKITTGRLHGFLPHVPQRFLRLGRSDKPSQLLRLLKQENQSPTIIFSNKSATCDWVSLFLNENNVACVNLNGDMPLAVRRGKFKEFQSGQLNVLSCTDVGSRGLDTTAVGHVVNYDFPLYTADYVHRCGRTGRLGSPAHCRVTNLVAGPREVDLVQKIELSARRMDTIPNVNANISKVIHDRILHNNRDLLETG